MGRGGSLAGAGPRESSRAAKPPASTRASTPSAPPTYSGTRDSGAATGGRERERRASSWVGALADSVAGAGRPVPGCRCSATEPTILVSPEGRSPPGERPTSASSVASRQPSAMARRTARTPPSIWLASWKRPAASFCRAFSTTSARIGGTSTQWLMDSGSSWRTWKSTVCMESPSKALRPASSS